MNKLSQTLLTSAAAAALAAAPAVAQPELSAFRVMALHEGHAVNKTGMHKGGACHHFCTTYTIGVYSYQPANAPPKTHLIYTYYKWNSSYNLCSKPKQHVKAPKKSIYAKIGTATETYSFGCSSGPTVFYGDTWTNKTGEAGNYDSFESRLIGHFKISGNKYKGSMALAVAVLIQ